MLLVVLSPPEGGHASAVNLPTVRGFPRPGREGFDSSTDAAAELAEVVVAVSSTSGRT